MAAEAQRAPRVARERTSLAAAFDSAARHPISRLRRFWTRFQPGFSIDRNNFVERWDSRGEGRATAVSYEGFGITGFFVVGLTPKAVRS